MRDVRGAQERVDAGAGVEVPDDPGRSGALRCEPLDASEVAAGLPDRGGDEVADKACQVQTRGPGGLGKPTRVPDVPTLPTLARVPPPHEADLVADRVCRTLGAWLTANGAGAEACLAALGFTVENDDLGASAGGHQAMLLPRPDGGFTVLVDPDLTPDESRAGADPGAVREGRLWHEFAHSLFYAPGTPPRRAALTAPHEESFCDAFAEGLGRRYGPESAALRRNG